MPVEAGYLTASIRALAVRSRPAIWGSVGARQTRSGAAIVRMQPLRAKPLSFLTNLWQYRAEVREPEEEIDHEDYCNEDGRSENVCESMTGEHENEPTDTQRDHGHLRNKK